MYGLQQPFLIVTPDDEPYDLTGKIVTLYVWDASGQLFSLVGVIDAVPTTGLCYFTPIAANMGAGDKGTYRFEIEMTEAGQVVKTKDYLLEITGTRP
jgi:hypothetical protein